MADGLSRADPQKPKHMHGAAAHHDSHRDIDSDTRQEFLFLYTDASANIRFAKAQQWRTLIYFSALCVGVVAVGVWLRWGDFSLATVGTILMLQSWQSSEAKKQAFMRAHFDELTRSALAQKSRFTSDVHRYIMLGFMLFYVEMATFAVSRMLWPHF